MPKRRPRPLTKPPQKLVTFAGTCPKCYRARCTDGKVTWCSGLNCKDGDPTKENPA